MVLERSPAVPVNGGCGFPRAARLLDGKAYGQVFSKNIRVSNRYWTVLAYSDEGSPARLGLAIAKKRARRAVDRNRLKRVVRESFRHQRASLHGFDVVVMNRDGAAAIGRPELRDSIDQLWNKLQHQRLRGAV